MFKKFLLALAAITFLSGTAQAATSTTMRDLGAGGTISAADLFVTRQGADTVDKKVTGTQLKTFMENGYTANAVTFLGTPSSANARAMFSDETGTGLIYFQGGALGTPSSGILTNATGLPIDAGTTGTLPFSRGGVNATTQAAALANVFGSSLSAATYRHGFMDGATDGIARGEDLAIVGDVALGMDALKSATTIGGNTAVGVGALRALAGVETYYYDGVGYASGIHNSAFGFMAGYKLNATGASAHSAIAGYTTLLGAYAGASLVNPTGNGDVTCVGDHSCVHLGRTAGSTDGNTFLGGDAQGPDYGTNNTIIGNSAAGFGGSGVHWAGDTVLGYAVAGGLITGADNNLILGTPFAYDNSSFTGAGNMAFASGTATGCNFPATTTANTLRFCNGGNEVLVATAINTSTPVWTWLGSSTNNLSFFGATTSSQFAGVISDETGTAGSVVLSVAPTITGAAKIGASTASANTLTVSGTAQTLLTATSSSTSGVQVALAPTTGREFDFYATGSSQGAGYFGVFAAGRGSTPLAIFDGSSATAGVVIGTSANAVFGWNNDTQYAGGAEDIGLSRSAAGVLAIGNGTAASTAGKVKAAAYMTVGTKFTISGCSAGTTVGGAQAGTFVSGTTGTCTVTITLNGATGVTAPTGWACFASNRTTKANIFTQDSSTATAVVMSGTTVTNDVIQFGCTPGY